MKKIAFLIFFCTTLIQTNAVLPDIGDNSIFTCIEFEDVENPGMCYGDISWTGDKKGNEKDGTMVAQKKAKKILNNYIQYFNQQKKKATRQGDEEAVSSWEAKTVNAFQSKEDINTCYESYIECEGDTDNNNTPPVLSQACAVITSPTTEDPRSRNQSNKKFIVNGLACSGAASSPVMKILLNGSQHCTGTLITPDTILTAAHCVKNIPCSLITVENADASQAIDAASCKAHSGYDGSSQENDVGLIFLESSFQGITSVKVNTLSTSAEVGDLAAFAGYGIDEDDDDILKATFNYISHVKDYVISTVYNQGDVNRGTTCSGDSGGPLFIYKDGEWRTQGTLSDGSALDCALPDTTPTRDKSNWANLTLKSNQNFIKNNTDGVLD